MNQDSKIIFAVIAASIMVLFGGYFLVSRQDSKKTTEQVTSLPELEVKQDDWVKGPATAQITMIEYLDFQCPACGSYHPLVKKLQKDFAQKMRLVVRHFPLEQSHQYARLAAQSAEAAGRQSKFWEMYDQLFQNQKEWSGAKDAKKIFISYAKDIGLDTEKFEKDLADPAINDKINADQQSGTVVGVRSTPSFFLNKNKIDSPDSYDEFKSLIEKTAAQVTIAQKTSTKIHAHFDFRLFINGAAVDFSQARYQSTHDKELDKQVHFHNKNGEVVHLHAKGITLRYFLKTLGIILNEDCLTLDNGQKYCNSRQNMLKLYVNGKSIGQVDYQPKDLDKVLISFGPKEDSSIQAQLKQLTDKACIYSEKCLERGKPEKEECVGGLGTECE